VAKAQYLIVADEELDAIEIASTHTTRSTASCARADRFFDTPYYITPNAPVGQEAFAVIREAMRGKPLLAPRGVNSPSPARLAEIRLTVWATGRHSAAAGIGQGR
jgi:hypothetical protein